MHTAVQANRARAPASRLVGVAAAVVTTAVGLATMVAVIDVASAPAPLVARELPAWTLWSALAAGSVIGVAAWAVRREHPRACVGLATAATGVLLPLWAGWWSLRGGVTAGLLAAAPLAIGGTGHVSPGWSPRRADRPEVELRVARALIGVAVFVHLLGYNPFADPGCAATCADVGPLLEPIVSTRVTVATASAASATAAALFAVVAWRHHRELPPLLVGSVLVALSAQGVAGAMRWSTWGDPGSSDVLLAAAPIPVTIVAAAAAGVVGRTARIRATVDGMVARLSDPDHAGGDRRGSVRAVHYATLDAERWVDAAGEPVSRVPEGSRAMVVSDDAGPVLRLVLDRTADEDDVIAALTPASLLALRNAQLSAAARARLADVRAARQRIVAATDAERRRIERDLHDGAQQRLVSVAFHLKLAAGSADGRAAAALDRAHGHVRDALAHLRRIAHGTVASALADEGLHAALHELETRSDVRAGLHIDLSGPIAQGPAAAVYHAAAAAVGLVGITPDAHVRVSVASADGAVVMRAVVDGAPSSVVESEYVDVTDRISAADGTVRIEPSADGTVTVTAVIPCAS